MAAAVSLIWSWLIRGIIAKTLEKDQKPHAQGNKITRLHSTDRGKGAVLVCLFDEEHVKSISDAEILYSGLSDQEAGLFSAEMP